MPSLVRLLMRTADDDDETYAAKIKKVDHVLDSLNVSEVDEEDNRQERRTALHVVARENHVELAKKLLRCGSIVNTRSHMGRTPLECASIHGHVEMVKLLLDEDPAAILEDLSSFAEATLWGNKTVVKEFISRYNQLEMGALHQVLDGLMREGHEVARQCIIGDKELGEEMRHKEIWNIIFRDPEYLQDQVSNGVQTILAGRNIKRIGTKSSKHFVVALILIHPRGYRYDAEYRPPGLPTQCDERARFWNDNPGLLDEYAANTEATKQAKQTALLSALRTEDYSVNSNGYEAVFSDFTVDISQPLSYGSNPTWTREIFDPEAGFVPALRFGPDGVTAITLPVKMNRGDAKLWYDGQRVAEYWDPTYAGEEG